MNSFVWLFRGDSQLLWSIWERDNRGRREDCLKQAMKSNEIFLSVNNVYIFSFLSLSELWIHLCCKYWSCMLFYFPKYFPIYCILQYLPYLSKLLRQGFLSIPGHSNFPEAPIPLSTPKRAFTSETRDKAIVSSVERRRSSWCQLHLRKFLWCQLHLRIFILVLTAPSYIWF